MLKIALFGLGRWGKNIERTLRDFPDVELVVVLRGNSVPEDIDGAIIATPITTHEKLALPLIKKGIPVFIEKPSTDSVESTKRLLVAARKKKTLVHVGHIHLHNPAFAEVMKQASGLGPLRYLYFEGFNNGPYRQDSTILWDWLPHPLSMVLTLVASRSAEVQAWGIQAMSSNAKTPSDIGVIRCTFANSTKLLCVVNWLSPEKRTKLTMVGTKSSLVYDDTNEKKILLYKDFGPVFEKGRAIPQLATLSHPAYESGKPLERELRSFVEAIQNKSRDDSQLEFALSIVKIIEAVHVSVKKGGTKIKVRF